MNNQIINKINLEQLCGTLGSKKGNLSHWPVRREEIQRIVEIAKTVYSGEGKPVILDVGCGNGFLSYLLAETDEVKVIAIDPKKSLINKSKYRHPNLKLEIGSSKTALEKYQNQVDLVFNSWMPQDINLTPDIRSINAQAIIYVEERGATGVQRFELIGQEDKRSYEPGKNYREVLSWHGPTCSEIQMRAYLLKNNKNLYVGTNYNCNIIEAQLRNDLPIPELDVPHKEAYPWEAEMQKLEVQLDKIAFYQNKEIARKSRSIFTRSGPRR